jgi:hypothetical protein
MNPFIIPLVELNPKNRYTIFVTQCHTNILGSLDTNQKIRYQNPNPNKNPRRDKNITFTSSILFYLPQPQST